MFLYTRYVLKDYILNIICPTSLSASLNISNKFLDTIPLEYIYLRLCYCILDMTSEL